MKLGRLGVWAFIDGMNAKELAEFARRMEGAGYSALWIPEATGRNSLISSGWILANTTKLVAATGIANIYARDPMAMKAAQYALNELSGGRFLLGLGVSHAPLVAGVRGHEYGKPVATMRAYLEGMAAAPYDGPKPAERPLTLLAALGPKMLELSRDQADGAHPYNVPPEHTREAREILGPGKMLAVEQMVVAETDPAKAREVARASLSLYLGLPNYCNNWRRLGFGDADFANGGSDRLIDTVVAWGDDEAIRARVDAHRQAGADHVCIQLLGISPVPDAAVLERLAAKLA